LPVVSGFGVRQNQQRSKNLNADSLLRCFAANAARNIEYRSLPFCQYISYGMNLGDTDFPVYIYRILSRLRVDG
jgi:hypothetical protein